MGNFLLDSFYCYTCSRAHYVGRERNDICLLKRRRRMQCPRRMQNSLLKQMQIFRLLSLWRFYSRNDINFLPCNKSQQNCIIQLHCFNGEKKIEEQNWTHANKRKLKKKMNDLVEKKKNSEKQVFIQSGCVSLQ